MKVVLPRIFPGNPKSEVRGFNPNQPREPNGRFASCDTGGGFGGEDLSTAKGKTVDKTEKSGIIANKEAVIEAFKETGFKGEIHIPPAEMDIDSLTFDSKHVNNDRFHNVTEKEAKQFIRDAKISYSKTLSDGTFENYIGSEGCTYVNVTKNEIRTSFKKCDFNKGTDRILDTIKPFE